MKKLTIPLLLAVLTLASHRLLAAPGNGNRDLQLRASAMTRSLAEQVHLNEGQYVQVKALNLRLLQEMLAAKAVFTHDADLQNRAIADAQQHYEYQLSSLLQPAQLALYQQNRASRTALNVAP
ncbi:hypothetical protein ACFPAF_07325 [Hymenobacter endophyticus]|jgi:antitoxin component of MazEF toxin-antitoxin module|uniref:TolC family protein n=1 Tax=Hymenobacter endophyticus TaxID=3076335 RepID=A0ABU3TFQ1_9BACT|nr:hypothetical protein [Hymenobacter endophyticus]MDU0370195.1 hypothetical protein [Hymenobacter endophyticus]